MTDQMANSPLRYGGNKILKNQLNMHSIDTTDKIYEEAEAFKQS